MGNLRKGLGGLSHILDGLVCFILAGLWTLPSLLNGFPLSYYDSAYYVYNAFHLLEPASIAWRPLTYSLFLRAPFEVAGFLGVVFLQNALVVGFLFKFSRLIWPECQRKVFFAIGILLMLTPLLHVSNFIMPDIFSPLAFFAMIGFFLCRTSERPFYFLATAFFSFMHFSNFICVIPLVIFHFSKNYRRALFAGVGVVLTILSVRFLFFFPKKSFEESAHYFVYSRLVAFQITEVYFSQKCPDEKMVFCESKNRHFAIWNSDRSPNSVAPGLNILPSVVQANQEILKSRLIWSYLFKGVEQSLLQAVLFAKPMPIILDDITLYRQYGKYAGEASIMAFANQNIFNGRTISFENYTNISGSIFFAVSLVTLLVLCLLFIKNLIFDDEKKVVYYYIAAYILNCIAIGFFSEPLSRYNNKLIWGFTFLTLVYVAKYLSERNQKNAVTLSAN